MCQLKTITAFRRNLSSKYCSMIICWWSDKISTEKWGSGGTDASTTHEWISGKNSKTIVETLQSKSDCKIYATKIEREMIHRDSTQSSKTTDATKFGLSRPNKARKCELRKKNGTMNLHLFCVSDVIKCKHTYTHTCAHIRQKSSETKTCRRRRVSNRFQSQQIRVSDIFLWNNPDFQFDKGRCLMG